MDRIIFQPAQVLQDTDLGTMQRNEMIALGYLAQATFGTGTVVDGLACTPTTPASLVVDVGQGSIFMLSTIDATNFGSLALDNTDSLVKVGINAIGVTPFTLAVPVTSGQSVNYLIQATLQESDGTPLVEPYYNPANPSDPFSGPANDGVAQNTLRTQRVELQLKAGTAATTGTQTTPAVDSGWVGLYVITVAHGATTVIAGNITKYSGAPFVDPNAVGRGIQPGRLINKQIFGTAGTFTYVPTPGTNSIVVEVQAGGGAGGGGPTTGVGQVSVGSGGAAGGFGRKRLTSGFSGATVIVGAGGAAVTGANGNNGSTSSFGAFVTATGGSGGTVDAAASPSNSPFGGSIGGTCTGGDINKQGGHGAYAWAGTAPLGGKGGASDFGEGGFQTSGLSAGNKPTSFGAGGSGASVTASGGPAIGGDGMNGVVVVFEYS